MLPLSISKTLLLLVCLVCGFLLLRIGRPSTPMLRQSSETVLQSANCHDLSNTCSQFLTSFETCYVSSFSVEHFRSYIPVLIVLRNPCLSPRRWDPEGTSSILGFWPNGVFKTYFLKLAELNCIVFSAFPTKRWARSAGVSKTMNPQGSSFLR